MLKTTRIMTIPPGAAGTAETLRVMAVLARDGAADPAVRRVAEEIAGRTFFNGGGLAETVTDLDRWIRLRYRFLEDGDLEVIQTPQLMLEEIYQLGFFQGDCDDVTTFGAAILKALGYVVRLVAIRTNPSNPEFLHVFLEANTPYGWRRLDPTVQPGLIHVSYGSMVEYV